MTGPGHEHWMRQALTLAQAAGDAGEVPVGAVVVRDGVMLGSAGNAPLGATDPTAHAEILALRQAASQCGNYRLPGCTLYVTIEPCTMCVGAMIHARIETLIFGAREPRAGAVVSAHHLLDGRTYNHRIHFQEGVLAEDCGAIMRSFFQARRNQRVMTSDNQGQ